MFSKPQVGSTASTVAGTLKQPNHKMNSHSPSLDIGIYFNLKVAEINHGALRRGDPTT